MQKYRPYSVLVSLIASTAIVSTTLVTSSSAVGAQEVKLKLASGLPVTHYLSVHGDQYLMKQAGLLSGGRLQFDYYPAQQLGKVPEMLTTVQFGVADMASIVPSYTTDKAPLSGVSELPDMFGSACKGTAALMAQGRPGGLLYENEWSKLGVLPLAVFASAPYWILTTKKRVATLENLAGVKLRTAGGAQDLAVQKLGAVPVHMAQTETFEAMQRGTVDGAIIALSAIKPWDLQTISKYATSGPPIATATIVFGVNLKVFKKLPEDLQQALVKAGEQTAKHLCEFAEADELEQKNQLEKGGMEMIEVGSTEKARWSERFAPIKKEWAAQNDRRGKPGTKTLEAFQKEIEGLK